jgi:hypothetical protein
MNVLGITEERIPIILNHMSGGEGEAKKEYHTTTESMRKVLRVIKQHPGCSQTFAREQAGNVCYTAIYRLEKLKMVRVDRISKRMSACYAIG